jgi:hypothetical protein
VKLWRISQTINRSYDTYDSAVIAAETEVVARNTHPNGKIDSYSWCDTQHVIVELIGKASPGISAGVIVASFNAG